MILLEEGNNQKDYSEQYKVVYDPAAKTTAGCSWTEQILVYKNGVLCEIITKQV